MWQCHPRSQRSQPAHREAVGGLVERVYSQVLLPVPFPGEGWLAGCELSWPFVVSSLHISAQIVTPGLPMP